jgi:hypothetical protein
VDYSSKAKDYSVRGIGSFFDTCLNLGHLSPYNFKNLVGHFPEIEIPKLIPLQYNIREVVIVVSLIK